MSKKVAIIQPTSPEAWEELGKRLTALQSELDEQVQREMTPELAAQIKHLRCVDGGTWGYIGKAFGGGQILGRLLCFHAATLLGENPHDEPWN